MANISYESKVGNKMSYLLLFLLLAFSGNPVFNENKLFLIIFGLLLAIVMLLSRIKIDFLFKKRLSQYIFYFLMIFFLQYAVLGFVSYEGIINFCAKILIGAVVVYLLDISFREKYFNIMVFLGVISIIGFLINLIGIRIPAIVEINNNSSIILFGTVNFLFDDGPMRNSGMFWEPGAYSGYILLIPLMYIRELKELWAFHKKKCILLIIVLLTTLSTTGYIILFIIILYYLLVKSKKKIFAYISFPFILVGIYAVFMQVDFLGDKIETQFSNSQSSTNITEDFSADRFGAFAFDLHYIEKHPIIGNGTHSKTRYADHQYLVDDEDSGIMAHGNGFSNFVASFGITSILFYLYLIYSRFPFTKKDSFFVIIILSLVLQGEQFLNYPMFLVLPFIILPHSNKYIHAKYSSSPYLSQP